MASVENRIVRMEFDNAAFEQKIQTTLSSISQLNKALKFEGAKTGLSDIQGSADKFNLGTMSTHIEGVSAKFLAMSTIAITVLSNITTKAMATGAQVVKSLSIEPVLAGFKEYEMGIGSIQTILSNTKKQGTNLDDVTKALGELNTYADKTIYNFGQMTRNIGTFTAAGVDLDTSVASIQGIANLAAISGSNADQASTAMYQLSQALASGELKLMDWNSVVNAGMGGKMFQEALFETGKALGTLQKTDISDTFDHWTKAGNSFRDTLKTGWVTTDVLTTTLNAFGGQMTEEQLIAKGFSKEMADYFIGLGQTGIDAATKVRTFSQLMDTTKEAIGSGWSETFRILIGNFTEATDLFTSISSAIGTMVGKSSDARNTLLQTWKDMGGRALLIEALRTAFQNLGEILAPIKEAFREIFPKTTAFQLMDLTKAFELLVIKLRPSAKTVENIHSIFKGFFSALQIGWEILKQTGQFFAQLFSEITGAGSGKFLDFLANIGDFFTELNNKLVEGEGIKNFFYTLLTYFEAALSKLEDLKDKFQEFFGVTKSKVSDAGGEAISRLGERAKEVGGVFERLGDIFAPVVNVMEKVKSKFGEAFAFLKNLIGDFFEQIGSAFQSENFNNVIDAINTGLFGGLLILFNKFITQGVKVQGTFTHMFSSTGLLGQVGRTLDGLTGTLQAMQANIKADTLLKIAEAMALLTVSLLVLATIDSEKLAKALTAMALGFGELMASFAVLNQIDSSITSTGKFDAIAAGMILLSTSILILSAAMKIMSTMSWDEIARGTTAITALLGVLTGMSVLMEKFGGSFVTASVGMTVLAVAINLLAIAMKVLATLSWEEIGKGLTAIVGLLGIIVAAMNLMPLDMPITALGLLSVATSMVILGAAMKIFATMSWEDIGKGMVVIAGTLGIIAAALNLMPLSTPLIAVGILAISASLVIIAAAMQIMGSMSWEDIGKGLTVLAGSLLILAAGVTAMTFALPGAIALGIIVPSLIGLAIALKQFAAVSWEELLKGLAAMASTLLVLGGVAWVLQSVTPAMIALGVALIFIGGGFALFGLGVSLLAGGLKLLTEVGAAAIKMIPELLKAFGEGIPALMQGFAEGMLEMATSLAKGAPVLIDALVVLLGKLLDGLIVLIPKALIIMGMVINGLLLYIKNNASRFVEAGLAVLVSFLKGIRDNIAEIVKIVADIIKNFLDAMTKEMPGLAKSLADLIIEMFKDVAFQLGRIAGSLLFDVGIQFVKGLYTGVTEGAASGVVKWFKELGGNILGWIGDALGWLVNKGKDAIGGLASGIVDGAIAVKDWFTNLPTTIKEWIGDAVSWLLDKGKDILTGLATGIGEKFKEVTTFFTDLPTKIKDFFIGAVEWLKDAGSKIIEGLKLGFDAQWNAVQGIAKWIRDLPGRILGTLMAPLAVLWDWGRKVIHGVKEGAKQGWEDVKDWFKDLPKRILMWTTFGPAAPLVEKVIPGHQELSALAYDVGQNIGNSFTEGISGAISSDENIDDAAWHAVHSISTLFNEEIYKATGELVRNAEPTITPVIDLTEMKIAGKKIGDYISSIQPIVPVLSYGQAMSIAASPSNAIATQYYDSDLPPVDTGIRFEQNIYSPTQLSVSDIFKQTRNQITMAKEELKIL